MRKNVSPWLHQLDKERSIVKLEKDIETDVAIIGAGIAGVATAFHLLEKTDKKVALLERYLLAHGATGHNAGQLVGHFERGLASLVEEFGLPLAIAAQRDVESAWDILEHMHSKAQLDVPLFKFTGHSGYSSFAQVLVRLENERLRVEGGLAPDRLLIADTCAESNVIPEKYTGLYEIISTDVIKKLLETDVEFVAASSYTKGCLNSALFCEKMIGFLERSYPDRFALYEHTPIHKIVLKADRSILDADTHTVTAQRVVLCTNGFEDLHILEESGLAIDSKYHYLVNSKMGYMSGYLEEFNKPATAISYFTDPSTSPDNSYFYLTRRHYEYERGKQHNLICIGGPDIPVEDTSTYSRENELPDERADELDHFVRTVYDTTPNKKIEYLFTWHGLMGYTPDGVRLVGPDPNNPVLLYNLGCNGVGILPSIYGGLKIARHINEEAVEKSIFDVPPLGKVNKLPFGHYH